MTEDTLGRKILANNLLNEAQPEPIEYEGQSIVFRILQYIFKVIIRG